MAFGKETTSVLARQDFFAFEEFEHALVRFISFMKRPEFCLRRPGPTRQTALQEGGCFSLVFQGVRCQKRRDKLE